MRSFDNSRKKTAGYVHHSVGIGNQRKVILKLKVVKGKETVPTLLGRDFLNQHKSTEFDWAAGKIRINNEWITPHLWVKGGSYGERIALIRAEEDTKLQLDINPDLDGDQKSRLLSLLKTVSHATKISPLSPPGVNTSLKPFLVASLGSLNGAVCHHSKKRKCKCKQKKCPRTA